jgi:hypothetical protein
MNQRAPLRAVDPGEKAVVKKSVAEAAKGDDELDLLVAMRDRIAEQVSKPDCPPRELASLTKRLQDIARDIRQLKAIRREDSGCGSDDISDAFDASAI